jgi:hypothetical protein
VYLPLAAFVSGLTLQKTKLLLRQTAGSAREYIYEKTERSPVILPIFLEV